MRHGTMYIGLAPGFWTVARVHLYNYNLVCAVISFFVNPKLDPGTAAATFSTAF